MTIRSRRPRPEPLPPGVGPGRMPRTRPVDPTPPTPHHEEIIVFNKLGMLADLMGNAAKLRETFDKALESLGQVEVEGSAGGGAVTAKVNGRLEVVSV